VSMSPIRVMDIPRRASGDTVDGVVMFCAPAHGLGRSDYGDELFSNRLKP
jgi:hypothetical protein